MEVQYSRQTEFFLRAGLSEAVVCKLLDTVSLNSGLYPFSFFDKKRVLFFVKLMIVRLFCSMSTERTLDVLLLHLGQYPVPYAYVPDFLDYFWARCKFCSGPRTACLQSVLGERVLKPFAVLNTDHVCVVACNKRVAFWKVF